MYYLCSENKGADQLRSYRAADLRLCFRICKKAGFLNLQHICSTETSTTEEEMQITEASEQPELDPELVLRKATRTECDSETVTVAVSKNVLQVSFM